MPVKAVKRPSGLYHLRGTHLGVRVDRSAGTRDREQAKILAAKEEAAIFERHAFGPRAVVTFAEAAAGYMRSGGDGEHLGPLLARLGAVKLKDIDQARLDACALALKPGVADATRKRHVYTPFIAVWNWAVRDGKAEPRKWMTPAAGPKRIKWLTPLEAEDLLAALPEQYRRLVAFYLGTGARASEALNLTWTEVSPAAKRVQLWSDMTKSGRDRWIDVPARTRALLPQRAADPASFVFLNSYGEPWHAYDAVNLALRRAHEHEGVRAVSCHVLRHTWATWAFALTKDLPRLMAQGGWASAELAMRYAHAGDDLAAEVRRHGWGDLLGAVGRNQGGGSAVNHKR